MSPATYQHETRDEYQIHQYWAHGWEEVSAHNTRREAIAELKIYRQEQPQAAAKLVKRRVRN